MVFNTTHCENFKIGYVSSSCRVEVGRSIAESELKHISTTF